MSKNNSNKEEFTVEQKLYRYRIAGQIAYEVHEVIKDKNIVKPGTKILEICNTVESLIKEKQKPFQENMKVGFGFPCNVSINNIAAHYSSPFDDENTIPEKSIVKLDLGVHIDGFIADSARTYYFSSEFTDLAKASEESFQAGLELIKPGASPAAIGTAIETKTKEFDFRPLRELSGHILDQWELHGPKTLPNIAIPHDKADAALKKDEVYALETFASTGSGSVHDQLTRYYIYSLLPRRAAIRQKTAKKILSHIFHNYKSLPFAERWLSPTFSAPQVRFALKQLSNAGVIHQYYVLADQKDSFVSQYEHTVIVTEEGHEVTTLPPFEIEEPKEEEGQKESTKEESQSEEKK
jgi:methionyl aminopeptidase